MYALAKKMSFRLLALMVVLDVLYVGYLWFHRDLSGTGEIPVSSFMENYISDRKVKTNLPEMKWQPISIVNIPAKVVRVFIIAEDTHFYVHSGFDIDAIKKVLVNSLSNKSIMRGASTISQQTAKNLFLYPKRSWVRKWHEVILTVLLEATMEKQRILELYLNIAEFGQGVYGVDAASYYYFGKSVISITARQASYLAASLPWPQRHNYKKATKTFNAHAQRIYSRSLKEVFPIK